jgi:hypothetical protein
MNINSARFGRGCSFSIKNGINGLESVKLWKDEYGQKETEERGKGVKPRLATIS